MMMMASDMCSGGGSVCKCVCTCVTLCLWIAAFDVCMSPSPCRLIPIEELSVGQITVLRKLSLVKLTALVELNNGRTNV